MSSALWRPFRVCRGRRQRNFFSQRLGQLRPADANPLSRLDLDLQPRDRPVASVGYRLLEQGRDDTQSCFTLHRGRAGRHAGLQRRNAAAHEVAAPQAYRVLAHAERLGDPRTGPASQRQQHSARSIRLAAITRTRQDCERPSLFFGRRQPRNSSHALPPRINASTGTESNRNHWSIGRILLKRKSVAGPLSRCLPLLLRSAMFGAHDWAWRLGGSLKLTYMPKTAKLTPNRGMQTRQTPRLILRYNVFHHKILDSNAT